MKSAVAFKIGQASARPGEAPKRAASQEDTVWQPRTDCAVRIVGAGGYVPPRRVMAEEMARAIPGWTGEQIVEKTGIVERRFLWGRDLDQGRAVPEPAGAAGQPASGVDMAEAALTAALKMASVTAPDVDMLIVVTCTPDQPRFSHDAMVLQRRLGIRRNVPCFVVDSGCGGALYLLDMVARML